MENLCGIKERWGGDFLKGLPPIIYHIVVVIFSAALALSLPVIVSFLAKNFLMYWSIIGNEKIFLISIEIVLAVLFILFSHYVSSNWENKKRSHMARAAGLVLVTPTKGFLARRRIKTMKKKQGVARDVMLISSTGFRTFVDPKGDLYPVLQNCRAANLMLLNPNSEGARSRAKTILHPDITWESFGEQIGKSIDFLKTLNAAQNNIKLKLYQDAPFLKLAILGDHIWVQHYHAGLDVQTMPKYVFKHDQSPSSLYVLFYQYFLVRWNDPDIPEYDFDTDDLVYRDRAGNEVRKEKFTVQGIGKPETLTGLPASEAVSQCHSEAIAEES